MRVTISLAAIALWGCVSLAFAQEYCVTCTGPPANYRCTIGGEPRPAGTSSRGQLLCITELARTGGHTSCSVGRNNEEPCPGELRTVMFPAVPTDDPSAPPIAQGQGPQMAEPAPAGDDLAAANDGEDTEPVENNHSTVADLTKKTIDTTGEGIKNAGDAVGGAVKKTWDCLSSFFGDC